MKTKEIRDLIDFIAKTGLDEVSIETEELKISVKKKTQVQQQSTQYHAYNSSPQPEIVPNTESTSEVNTTPIAENDNYTVIKSPMIGTFYTSSNPESPPFVSIGSSVSANQTVCIIEAMKLFNEIESEVSGKIVKILVENASPVEYDQPLFLVEPH